MRPGERWPALALLALAACQSPLPQPPPAALIVDADAASRADLQQAVAALLGLPGVTLADDALTRSSVLLIERDLHVTGRDPGRPEAFNLVLQDGACVLVRARDGQRATLARTRCQPPASPPSQSRP